MGRHLRLNDSALPATAGLASAIANFAHTDGDYATVIPALSLHRRKGPTEPLHCIYGLGLGVVAQGHKQVLLRGEVIDYGPGQSMLTTIDLPVISHVTRATVHEPFLGLMLTLDSRQVVQMAAEMQLSQSKNAYQPISIETLDESLLDALVRLVELLDEPGLVARLAPLIQQEVIVRLLAGPHAPQLQHLAAHGSPSQNIARSVAWLKQNFKRALQVDNLAARA